MFAKQLMQIHGITLNSAAAIVERCATPTSLQDMIQAEGRSRAKETLAAITCVNRVGSEKRLGDAKAAVLVEYYGQGI